jgi:hypothetical protein
VKEPLTEEQVYDRAKDWAHLHKNPKTRDQMDKLLEGLSPPDQRRVYLCGQRVAGGLPYKVLPRITPPTRKEEQNGKPNQGAQRRNPAAAKGSPAPETKKTVGADSVAPKSSNRRSRAGGAK